MRDYAMQHMQPCHRLTLLARQTGARVPLRPRAPGPPPNGLSRVNHASVNSNANHPYHPDLRLAGPTRAVHRGPPATIFNPPALPDMGTSLRRAAVTPPIGGRLRPTGPRMRVPVKM